MTEDELSNIIIGAAIEVHRTLGGPGLLESVYENALEYELKQRGLHVDTQHDVQIRYKDVFLRNPLRLDIVVENKVIIECKSVLQYNDVFEAQALTYLRLSGLKLAIVINFGEKLIKNGVHRVVNRL
jgi:GxxExxY protein